MIRYTIIFAFCALLVSNYSPAARYPLHEAVKQGNVSEVTRLIGAGVDVNQLDDYSEERVKVSVEAAEEYFQQPLHRTPLEWAINNGQEEIAHHLLQAGADPSYCRFHGTPLYQAVVRGECRIVCWLIERWRRSGASIDKLDPLKKESPLHAAVQHDQLSVFQLLLNAGARVNTKEFFLAAQKGNPIITEQLIRAGTANRETLTEQQYTQVMEHQRLCKMKALGIAMHMCAQQPCMAEDYLKVMDVLFNNGLSIDEQNGEKPLRTSRGAKPVVMAGETPLIMAVRYGATPAVIRLLQMGADITAQDGDNFTALDWAAIMQQKQDNAHRQNYREVINILLKHGASVTNQFPLDKNIPQNWTWQVKQVLLSRKEGLPNDLAHLICHFATNADPVAAPKGKRHRLLGLFSR